MNIHAVREQATLAPLQSEARRAAAIRTPLALTLGLLAFLLANAFLLSAGPLYIALFAAQIAFYGVSFLAWLSPAFRKVKPAKLAYYFTFMNLSVILGFFRFLRGRQSATWEKARRTLEPAPGD